MFSLPASDFTISFRHHRLFRLLSNTEYTLAIPDVCIMLVISYLPSNTKSPTSRERLFFFFTLSHLSTYYDYIILFLRNRKNFKTIKRSAKLQTFKLSNYCLINHNYAIQFQKKSLPHETPSPTTCFSILPTFL